MQLPAWVVLHIPHDSTVIPASVREQFLLSDAELALELQRITDHHTLALFATPEITDQVVAAPVSRLVVDVERFADDAGEPMAQRGMGAVYTQSSQNTPLRRPLSASEREALMQAWYHPHHARLQQKVARVLEQHGKCLIIDCHSFPDKALPYERADAKRARPDICIGTDSFHTSRALTGAVIHEFSSAGWSIRLNDPFAGALVPSSHYHQDKRVSAVMIEVNRKLYLQGDTADQCAGFDELGKVIREACIRAILRAEQVGALNIKTCYSKEDETEFKRIRRKATGSWRFLAAGEWSQSPYHEGNMSFSYRCSPDRKYWALMAEGFPRRIVAVAEAAGSEETEMVTAQMMKASKLAGGEYIDLADDWGEEIDGGKFWAYLRM